MSANTNTALVQDDAQEERIYKKYRHFLRSSASSRREDDRVQTFDRAAGRRQQARKLTVEQFSIPFAEVKRIVAKHDTLNGITHDHTPQYIRSLELMRAQDDYDQNPTPCPSCGETENVRVRWEPFEYDVNNAYVPMVSCFICYFMVEKEAEDVTGRRHR
jgi:hypothetical protein